MLSFSHRFSSQCDVPAREAQWLKVFCYPAPSPPTPIVSDHQDYLKNSRMSVIAAFSGPGLTNCVYLADGSIDARVKRSGSRRRKQEEPRSGLLEELEGPPQFKPWVAGPGIMSKISILGDN